MGITPMSSILLYLKLTIDLCVIDAQNLHKTGENMKFGQASVASGLSTDTIQVKNAGVHSVFTRTTCLIPSGLVVTISQSGSASSSVTSPTTAPRQRHVELNAKFNCAVGDILTVAISSSANVDQPPSLIQTIINAKQGI